jgi:chorismate dehydratase
MRVSWDVPEESRVAGELSTNHSGRIRVGAVGYLNARPLTFCLRQLAPHAEIIEDLPSRLADGLADGRLDVALIPSIERFRHPDYTIVSDACVACDGPVRSIKLYGRVPLARIRTLALDEGSRTSAALTRILLKERFGLEPELGQLPIGASLAQTDADAVMLIGDRAMLPVEGSFEFVWDLGEQWSGWTGLPFVFATWTARRSIDLKGLDELFAAARDEGVCRLVEIADREAPLLGISEEDCLSYFRDNLRFRLGPRERQGLEKFCQLAAKHRLAPTGGKLAFCDHESA